MKPPARRYQEQITGHSADDAYWVGGMSTQAGGVKFDGFMDGVLLAAKGPGYAKFFEGLEPKRWVRAWVSPSPVACRGESGCRCLPRTPQERSC